MMITRATVYTISSSNGTYIQVEANSSDFSIRKFWADDNRGEGIDIEFDQIDDLIVVLNEMRGN